MVNEFSLQGMYIKIFWIEFADILGPHEQFCTAIRCFVQLFGETGNIDRKKGSGIPSIRNGIRKR